MESIGVIDNGFNDFKSTELKLGLPGRDEADNQELGSSKTNKRAFDDHLADESESRSNSDAKNEESDSPPASKAQIVGWPPVRSYRKNSFQQKKTEAGNSGNYIKVSMDGAPFLRKIDLKGYKSYPELLKALENMFKLKIGEYSEREGYEGSEYAPAYEDKDGDLMLVGDVPWDMFISTCKKLRVIKGSEAKGLGFGV